MMEIFTFPHYGTGIQLRGAVETEDAVVSNAAIHACVKGGTLLNPGWFTVILLRKYDNDVIFRA